MSIEHEKAETPWVSVVCLNKNHVDTLRQTITTVLGQTVSGLEFIVADGGSNDGSVELLKSYPQIRLLEGTDKSRDEGVLRAVRAARGKYIAFTTSTDGYVSLNWLERATNYLEANPAIALAWGASIEMQEAGLVGKFYPEEFSFNETASQGKDLFFDWLVYGLHGAYIPELGYCVRSRIYKMLIEPDLNAPDLVNVDPILRFHFEFMRRGYLAFYLSVLANFGRIHDNQGQHTPEAKRWEVSYESARRAHVKRLLSGEAVHVWRDPSGREIQRLERSDIVMRLLIGKVKKPFRKLRRSVLKKIRRLMPG